MTITTKGECAGAPATLAGNKGFSLISNEKLLQLYVSLLKCRMINEGVQALLNRRGAGRNGIAVEGREAAAVGVAIDLLPADRVFPSDCDFIVNFINGDPLTGVVRSLIESVTTPKSFDGINLAMAAAMANKAEKNGRIAVAFFSEESGAASFRHEALANAADNRLPMLFVCHSRLATGSSNGWVRPSSETNDLKAPQCSIPVIPVDSSDVVAVYRVATEAIAHARKGNGATLIDCVACSPGSAQIDSIAKMEAYLSRKGLFHEGLGHEVATGFSRQLDAAIEDEVKRAISA
jgi:TPP-dependent pyruvate/acetoin dehydrogenase alpha subunit